MKPNDARVTVLTDDDIPLCITVGQIRQVQAELIKLTELVEALQGALDMDLPTLTRLAAVPASYLEDAREELMRAIRDAEGDADKTPRCGGCGGHEIEKRIEPGDPHVGYPDQERPWCRDCGDWAD